MTFVLERKVEYAPPLRVGSAQERRSAALFTLYMKKPGRCAPGLSFLG
jgi:hypothetical protein